MAESIFNYPGTLAVIVGLPLGGIIAKFFGVPFGRIARWYCYASVFCVLVVVNSIFFPFIGGKDYFFRFTIELGIIAFLLWWAFEAKDGEVKHLFTTSFKQPLVVAVSIFALTVVLASLFGFDAHAAFWSNYERGEGGFQMLHYYALFMLLVMLFRREEDWQNMFKFSLVAACGMIGYGILGNFSVGGFIGPYSGSASPPVGWWHILMDGRFQGSLGNPAYVAPYLLFSMFYAAYLFTRKAITKTLTKAKTWGYGILIFVFCLFFILSQTRGAFLGLGAGIFAILVYLIWSGRGTLRKWSLITLGLFIVLGGIGFAIRNVPAVANLPEGRLLQISLSDSSAQTRLWVWGSAWQGFLERPIFGWGPENFTAVFDKYFNPNFFVPGQQTETWFDRAHSVFFDYLAETGIIGLLSYLSIFVIFYWNFFRKRKGMIPEVRHAATAHVLQHAVVFALPVAYLVQGVAIFDVLPMYVNLFLFFGFASYYFAHHHEQGN